MNSGLGLTYFSMQLMCGEKYSSYAITVQGWCSGETSMIQRQKRVLKNMQHRWVEEESVRKP